MRNLTQILALFSPQNLKSYKYSQELSDKGIDGRGKKGKARDMQAPTVQRRALLLLTRSECRRRRGGGVALESSIAYVWKRRWFFFFFFLLSSLAKLVRKIGIDRNLNLKLTD
jgi:hypothetical protein